MERFGTCRMPRASRLTGRGVEVRVSSSTDSTTREISISVGSIAWEQQPQVKQVGGQFWSPSGVDAVSPSHGSVQEIAKTPEALRTSTATTQIMANRLTTLTIAARSRAPSSKSFASGILRPTTMIIATLVAALGLTAVPQDTALAPRLSQERGNVVVVNFWAVWCEPCKREIPMLAKVAREYTPRGVTFVGASIDDPEEIEQAKAFAKTKGVDYPLVFGVAPPEMVAFRLGDSVPVTMILDRDGVRRFRLVGEVTAGDLRQRLDWILAPDGRTAPKELLLPDGMSIEHFRDMHEDGASAAHSLEDQRAREEGGSAVPG
jgi:thiol-disulfide isomerase/thioredoxin